MDMESLRIFLDVQRSGSITAAANTHYITQPALGKRIAQLEKELGVTLLLRGKGHPHVELTPEGKAFSDIAERMLMLYEQAQELREDSSRQYLTVACIRSAHDFLMPKLLVRLKEEHPELCVTVEDHRTVEIMPLLENRRVDVGITQSAAASQHLMSELLYEEPYFVVLRPENVLFQKQILHPSELDASHGIFQAFDRSFEEWFDQWWQPYSVKVRVNTTPSAEHYFSEDEDWMIVPQAVASEMLSHGFAARPLADSPPMHRVYMAWHSRNQRESLSWFQAAIRSHICSSTNVNQTSPVSSDSAAL